MRKVKQDMNQWREDALRDYVRERMTPEQFAEHIGIKRNAVYEILNGGWKRAKRPEGFMYPWPEHAPEAQRLGPVVVCGETMSESIVWTHKGSTMPYISRFTTTLANGESYLLGLRLLPSGTSVVGCLNQIEFLAPRPGLSMFCQTIRHIGEKRFRKGVKELAQHEDAQDRLREAYDRTFQAWAEGVFAEQK
jgi:hypothetical protein